MNTPPPGPPGGDSARERLAALPPDKRAALALLLRRQGRTLESAAPAGDPADGPPLVAQPRGAELPLSFDQQRVWFLHQLDPQGSALNLQLRTIVEAPVAVLDAAVAALVARHEILRTVYRMGAREPQQLVLASAWVPLRVDDLSGVDDAALTAAALPRIGAEREQPFDLTRGVWRGALFQLSRGRGALCLTVHHIATDGWSIDALIAELRELCAAHLAGRAARLPVLPIQYADFALWQREWLQGAVLAEQLGWWRARLAGMPQRLDLRTDLPRPPVASGRGAAISVALPAPLVEGLRALAQRQQATLFMTLLALFKCLLARHSGQTDVVVGTPVAGRNRPELEHVQGLFLNSLVLRTEVGGDVGFDTVLARVRDTVSGAFTHAELPFEKLVAALQPQRDLSRNPLFQVLFTQPILDRYVSGVEREPTGGGPVELPQGQGEFDIGLWFEDYGGEATLSWHYAADLFLPATIERLARQFLVIARAVVADPAVHPERIDLLDAAEHAQLRAAWAAARVPLPTQPLTRQFEAQAGRRPAAPALRFEGRLLSYAELNARANRLARHLQAAGAGCGHTVAVHLERGIEMVVAVLAVLKAGAAYVPMDPAYPSARLAAMLDDSGALLRLTQTSLREALPIDKARALCVDAEADAITGHDGADLAVAPALGDPAYVIYTSGSTGRPKGVMVEHLALANFLAAMAHTPGCGETDVLAALTTLSFDIAGLELYLPLVTGASIVLAPAATVVDGAALARLIDQSQATLVQATPATWRLLLAAGWQGHPRLTLLCGGEALPRELAERLLACGGALWNLYGPTETTIWSAAGRVHSGRGPVPLGVPIANTQLHVLDRHQQPVPAGAVGELAIGGAGVARGYWQRDELTAERFPPDPFAATPGARMYLTGDAVRRLADGTLEFIGRNDGQVKLRGFRIELGEVEAVLAQVGGVAQAVALLREDRPGDARLVAYLVPAPGQALAADAARQAALRMLPTHMVPAAWVVLPALPLTPNGKVDRKALPPPQTGPAEPVKAAAPAPGLEQRIALIWQQVLGVTQVGRHDNFFDLGGHSLGFVMVQVALREALGIELPVVELFEHPTVEALARRLARDASTAQAQGPNPLGFAEAGPARGRRLGEQRRAQRASAVQDGAIAVVALHGRFPGAADLTAFWSMLCEGREGLRFFSEDELIAAGHDPQQVRHPDYVKAKGVAPDADLFDAGFFGYSPADATALDPQQRLFLEHAWSALEAAGIDAQRHPGTVGVYASTSLNSYSLQEALAGGDAGRLFLNDKDYLATRAAYKLDLHGPCLTVQTACSSSLVALAEACEALLANRCDLALAGGVSVSAPLASGHLWQEGGVASRDGHCRAFDAAASGCVAGNGAGVVVLERLADAVAAGHAVLAVVRGVAVNNDGAAKAGFTAPSIAGQAEAIATAQALAGVAPESIGYVETHGTGTVLGDPIELAALTRAFRDGGDTRRQGCAIGSLKSNIGHLDAAAGVAGFIKAVLCLQHRQLPPSLNFTTPNPKIDFAGSPFEVNTRLTEWPAPQGHPRRAGVSSFGIGGTNAHVVLEEAPDTTHAPADGGPQLLVLSARSRSALDAATAQLADHLEASPATDLAAAAATLQLGRRAFEHRRSLVAVDVADALRQLRGAGVAAGVAPPQAAGTVFLFSGQGAQYVGMARGLLDTDAGFRSDVEDAARRLRGPLGLDLMDLLAPADDAAAAHAADLLLQTRHAQPALFVVEWALARLWQRFGVEPEAMLGHSLGEWVAACLAGVFTLDDALALVALRGRLMQAQPPGTMLSLPLAADRAAALLDGSLSLAADNADGFSVVAGPADEIAALEQRLAAQGIEGTRLHTSHAFHSAAMDAVVPAFTAAVAAVPRQAPQQRFVSNLSGTWITAEEATDPAYWGRQVRATVRFREGLGTVLERPVRLLEIGPGRTLCIFAEAHALRANALAVVASLRRPREQRPDDGVLLGALGQLWRAGQPVHWDALHPAGTRRIALPTYPFERQRYWVSTAPLHAGSSPLDKRADIAQWLYQPTWLAGLPLAAPPAGAAWAGTWLVLHGGRGVGAELVLALRERGATVVQVTPGDRLREPGPSHFQLDPVEPGSYRKVLDALHAAGQAPQRVVHAFGLSDGGLPESAALDLGFYSVLYLMQALAARFGDLLPRLDLLSNGLHAVTGAEQLRPEAATVLGLARVLPQESPGAVCRVIDIDPAATDAAALLGELADGGSEPVVALRGRRRWRPRVEPAGAPGPAPFLLSKRGVYLVTGGLGGVGLAIAAHLAKTAQARLVLLGRTAFPPREGWDAWAAGHDAADPTCRRIALLRAMEADGAELMFASGDVADAAAMQALAASVRVRFGAVDGVIHAAGVLSGPSMAPIVKLGRAECEAQFRPKQRGLRALEAAFDGPQLALMMVVSSISTVLGGLGLAAYAAANQFMDTLVQQRRAEDRRAWVSIDWDAWHFGPPPVAARRGSIGALALLPDEGLRVFDRVLALGAPPQLVVSTVDLERRIERGRQVGREPEPAGDAPAPTAHARPALAAAYVAPRTELERAIAEVWQELLGIEQVGIYDNFFDLGGHSLLAVRAAARLREKLGVSLSLERFLELGTVDQVAWQSLGQVAAGLHEAGAAAPAADGRADATEEVVVSSAPQAPEMAVLEPFFFGPEGRALFGLLRRAPRPRGAGVVLCAPHGHEFIRCHRALRQLAELLVQAGFDVLSFDYHGTGDSGGHYADATLPGCAADTAAAIEALRVRTAPRFTALLGLRVGGALALSVASARDDVDALALWDPVVAGADLAAEIAQIARLQALTLLEQQDAEQSDVLAWPVTGELVAGIAAIDLCRTMPALLPPLLVVETGHEGSGRRLADLARAQGTRADYRRVDEARVWTREPYEAVAPRDSMAALRGWLQEVAP